MAVPRTAGAAARSWQLDMFRKGLKKRQRLEVLTSLLAPIPLMDRCLLLTCGDNNGAMNYFLRNLGGRWSWADLEDTSIAEMSELLGDPVTHVHEDYLPYQSALFDRIVVIDVHEHVEDPAIVTRELARILKSGGQLIITTPNGDETKLAVRIKSLVGMSVDVYGHKRIGLTAGEICALMSAAGVDPLESRWFSRFFTEMLELTINLLYVKVLRKGDPKAAPAGDEHAHDDHSHDAHAEIAPATAEQLSKVRRSYRIYSMIFPVYWLISQLDRLLSFREGYCVVVDGRRR